MKMDQQENFSAMILKMKVKKAPGKYKILKNKGNVMFMKKLKVS